MPRVACLFLLLFTALVARSTAADQNFSLTLFDLPPHGVYAKIRIEKTSDRIDAPNPPGVSAQVRRFAETVAPGRTLTIASSPPAGTASKPFLDLAIVPVPLDRRTLSCALGYIGSQPNPPELDKVALQATELAHTLEPKSMVITTASVDDVSISDYGYNGPYVFDYVLGRTVTLDEHSGTTVSKTDKGNYLLIVKEAKPIVRGDDRRLLITVTLVFPQRPSTAEAKKFLLAETLKLRAKDVSILAAPCLGPKDKSTPWTQLRDDTDSRDRYILFDYTGAKDELTELGGKRIPID